MIGKAEVERLLIERIKKVQLAMVKCGLSQMMAINLTIPDAIHRIDLHPYLRLVILADSLPQRPAVTKLLADTRAKVRAALEEGNLLHDLRPGYTVEHLLDEVEAACLAPQAPPDPPPPAVNLGSVSPSPA